MKIFGHTLAEVKLIWLWAVIIGGRPPKLIDNSGFWALSQKILDLNGLRTLSEFWFNVSSLVKAQKLIALNDLLFATERML